MPCSKLLDWPAATDEDLKRFIAEHVPAREPFVRPLTVTPVVDDVFVPLVIPQVDVPQVHTELSTEIEKWRRYAAALEELVRPGVAAAIRKAVWG